MTEEVSAKAKTLDSAILTMTKDYLVVKGKYFEIKNNYLHSSKRTQAIAVKDILSMEYLTIRSKRLFIVFMILMTIVVFGGVSMRKIFSITKQIDKEAQKMENLYNYMVDEDIDISVTGFVKNGLPEFGIKGIVTVYVVLIMGSMVCFLLYLLKPFRVLYISTLGKIIAVERKFYDKAELDAIVKVWEMQLR